MAIFKNLLDPFSNRNKIIKRGVFFQSSFHFLTVIYCFIFPQITQITADSFSAFICDIWGKQLQNAYCYKYYNLFFARRFTRIIFCAFLRETITTYLVRRTFIFYLWRLLSSFTKSSIRYPL